MWLSEVDWVPVWVALNDIKAASMCSVRIILKKHDVSMIITHLKANVIHIMDSWIDEKTLRMVTIIKHTLKNRSDQYFSLYAANQPKNNTITENTVDKINNKS